MWARADIWTVYASARRHGSKIAAGCILWRTIMMFCRRVFLSLILGFCLMSFCFSQEIFSQISKVSVYVEQSRNILFFGDSLTAGFGLTPSQAFPAYIQNKIQGMEWNFSVFNAGLSGETSSAGLRRVDWLLRNKVDVLVLALGANDGLRGISPELTEKNLQGIIDKVRRKNPRVEIVIAGMRMPPSLGLDYNRQFEAVFSNLARRNDGRLIPFLLEGVAGMVNLNLDDGIHPTAEGHKIIAKNVWLVLKPVLEKMICRQRR